MEEDLPKEATSSQDTGHKTKRQIVPFRNEVNLIGVMIEGGGRIPKEFEGVAFNSTARAQMAIDSYYAKVG